jgi:signal transduction histidine kinase
MRALGSLQNRIFLASALLATLSIGAAVYFVSVRMTQELEAELQRDLNEAASLVDQQRASLFDSFTRTARLIADLPRFKAVVELRDPPTAEPVAREYRDTAGADLFVVTDRSGAVLAAAGGPAIDIDGAEGAAGIPRALAGESVLDFWPQPRGVLQVVTVPVTLGLERPEILGTLTTGYLLDEQRAAQFKTVTGADVAFALGGQVRASTLGPSSHADLAPLAAQGGASSVTIGADEWTVLVKPLSTAPDTISSSGAEVPVALILRSRTEHRHTLATIQTALGGLGLATVLLAVAVSYGVARTITRPLAAITDHMRQVAATGDLTRKLPLPGPKGFDDEDARVLATTFNTLTDSIATFQREAAQRERLSSLGRMSTVLAHEIRNPLMIIKGALRQVAREGASPLDIRESAADIDEEIQRLNRLVNEVLDFARPIRFDRQSTDINAVCKAATTAVTAAEAEPRVLINLDPDAPLLQSDGERLRTALVNLLTNARHAVRAQPPPAETHVVDEAASNGVPVVVTTRRLGPHRLAIVVSDRGVGIAPDDLSRIFDPYFTTRRTGTGLGLPIAKNIIEGLGGSIAVMSQPGAGTDVRIELGDAPAHQGRT